MQSIASKRGLISSELKVVLVFAKGANKNNKNSDAINWRKQEGSMY